MFYLKGPHGAEPEDHLWSADHSLRNAGVKEPIMRYFSSNITYYVNHSIFLLQKITDIQENTLLYYETVINTVFRNIQISEQKLCEHVTFL